MLTHRNLLTACFAALLALGLAACGTGGNGAAPVAMMDDPVPDPVPTAGEMAAATALADYDAAKTTYDAAIAAYEAGPSQMTAAAAKDAADALKAAADTAAEAAANGNDAQKLAIAEAVIYANNAVTTAAGAVTDAKEAADAADATAAAEEAARLALVAYDDAKTDYDTARATYEGGMTLANAQALRHAAAELKAKADAAMTAAADGTSVQQTAAAAAVTEADDAVKHAAIVLAAIQGGISETDAANLLSIQTAAADAATAAGGFATDAETAATMAETYAENRALIQSVYSSQYFADMAEEHAGYARTAADDAKTAAGEAGAATTLAEAIAARDKAVAAQNSANDHKGHVAGFRDRAVDAAGNEVKVVEGGYQIGDTTVMVDAAGNVVTVTVNGEAQTTITGLMEDVNPEHTARMVGGVPFDARDGDADTPVADVQYVQAVAARTFDIGKTIDSANDMARLMLVTHYAGSKTVNVYAYSEAETAGGRLTGRMVGTNRIQTVGMDSPDDATDDVFVTLKAVGMYYLAGLADETNGLAAGDEVGAMADAKQVYSYLAGGAATMDDTTDDYLSYVVLQTTSTTDGVTTLTYRRVDIDAVASDETTEGTADNDIDDALGAGFDADGGKQVTAALPEATAYEHINFGVWAGLADAKADGTHGPAALGIGFVDSIGDGMTGDDMPNNGEATYNGNWVATVQAAHEDGEGAISMEDGAATLTANFGKGDITAMLMGLARLDGDITGNAFSGTKATVDGNNMFDLTDGADFTGTFNGAFFGSQAAEAGGVFNFNSEDNDNEDGAFAGAFGGDRDDN